MAFSGGRRRRCIADSEGLAYRDVTEEASIPSWTDWCNLKQQQCWHSKNSLWYRCHLFEQGAQGCAREPISGRSDPTTLEIKEFSVCFRYSSAKGFP